jgi:hypothetical protein
MENLTSYISTDDSKNVELLTVSLVSSRSHFSLPQNI